jgi:hypothetical protein
LSWSDRSAICPATAPYRPREPVGRDGSAAWACRPHPVASDRLGQPPPTEGVDTVVAWTEDSGRRRHRQCPWLPSSRCAAALGLALPLSSLPAPSMAATESGSRRWRRVADAEDGRTAPAYPRRRPLRSIVAEPPARVSAPRPSKVVPPPPVRALAARECVPMPMAALRGRLVMALANRPLNTSTVSPDGDLRWRRRRRPRIDTRAPSRWRAVAVMMLASALPVPSIIPVSTRFSTCGQEQPVRTVPMPASASTTTSQVVHQ